MILRPRPADARPPSLDLSNPESAGSKEQDAIALWYQSRGNNPPPERPYFKAYKGKDVTRSLEAIFKHKCAYCESRYSLVQPVDVEHWRPKAEIEGVPKDQGGYEWLAMVWENLLPSCIDCNRGRNQTVPDSRSGSGWIQRKVGKANQFPLADPALRWTFGNTGHPEEPLLLDPCRDDPSEYFDFEPTGVVLPKAGLSPENLRRAMASIQVYALNRKALVDERHRHVLRMEPIFNLVRFLYQASSDPTLNASFRDAASTLVAETLDRLRESCSESAPYSQFLKRRLQDFLIAELGAS